MHDLYSSDRDRPRKRSTQEELTDRLVKVARSYPQLRGGEIAVLSGPSPIEAIFAYFDKGIGGKFLLIDNDPVQIKTARSELRKWVPGDPNFRLLGTDVFKIPYPDELTGLDLDFCERHTPTLTLRVLDLIEKVRTPCFWVRLTTCIRGVARQETIDRLDKLEILLGGSGIDLLDTTRISYRDGSPMQCWQTICQKKEKDMAKRTVKQLPEEWQQMARALVIARKKKGYDYTDKDISNAIGITTRSVAALQANVTMGRLK